MYVGFLKLDTIGINLVSIVCEFYTPHAACHTRMLRRWAFVCIDITCYTLIASPRLQKSHISTSGAKGV